MMKAQFVGIFGCILLATWFGTSLASWPQNGLRVSDSAGNESLYGAVADGAGGVILSWSAMESGHRQSQRLDPLGTKLWPEEAQSAVLNGIPVSDGAGGAFLCFGILTAGEWPPDVALYAQHIDSSGEPLWGDSGRLVYDGGGYQTEVRIVSDGLGGIIVAWEGQIGENNAVYVQRLDGDGLVLWPPAGVPVCNAEIDQSDFLVIADGTGGAIFAWEDGRNNGGDNFDDIYAQCVLPNGSIAWAVNGIPICTAIDWQTNPGLCTDGAGGAIISWNDGRNLIDTDVYAQRLDPAGVSLWAADGVVVSGYSDGQSHQWIDSDGQGGAVLVWEDRRNIDTTLIDVYAQRIDGDGNSLWTLNGVAVNTADIHAQEPRVVCDQTGASYIFWDHGYEVRDLFVQKLDPAGNLLWASEGVAVCVGEQDKNDKRLVPDGEGGAIMVWADERAGEEEADIYAQRIFASGTIDAESPSPRNLILLQNHPNPFNPVTTISYILPGADRVTLRIYDAAGRLTRTLLESALKTSGRHTVQWDGRDEEGRRVASGCYSYRVGTRSDCQSRTMVLIK